jgi:hypothetical protein
MSRVGFEPKIPLFERPKTVHALDRATIVIRYLVSEYKLKSAAVYEWNPNAFWFLIALLHVFK